MENTAHGKEPACRKPIKENQRHSKDPVCFTSQKLTPEYLQVHTNGHIFIYLFIFFRFVSFRLETNEFAFVSHCNSFEGPYRKYTHLPNSTPNTAFGSMRNNSSSAIVFHWNRKSINKLIEIGSKTQNNNNTLEKTKRKWWKIIVLQVDCIIIYTVQLQLQLQSMCYKWGKKLLQMSRKKSSNSSRSNNKDQMVCLLSATINCW